MFIRKCKPDVDIIATVAIFKGVHDYHGTTVYCTQGKRCCLVLDTTYGLSDDEALWLTLAGWATFQPRLRQPRKPPGRLFYPVEYSHVFEKYWDYLPNLTNHTDFVNESPFRQEQMQRFSSALSAMDLSGFIPSVAAEASQSHIETVEDAVISRLRPIQDGLDFWGVHGGAVTGSGALAPGLAQTMF
jgi:hypothetical protein